MVVTKEHCFYCFDVLDAHFKSTTLDPPNFDNHSYPLFVTWHVKTSSYYGEGDKLRGCIGNFEAQSLHQGLKQYAMISAFRDHRFQPIQERELPSLTCSVSLLYDFSPGEDYLDWEIGVHGIRIEFVDDHHHKRRTATYLPEIAEEQGWTKEETIDSLLRKGGFRSRITPEVRNQIKLTRYKSSKHTVSYDDWMKQRI